MVVQDFIKKIVRGRTSYGVEVNLKKGGDAIFNIVKIGLVKGKLEVFEEEIVESCEAFFERNWTKNVPFNVVYTGKGVLQKKQSSIQGKSDKRILQEVLPNARLDDFFMTVERIDEESAWVSLLRKETISELQEQFYAAKLHVLSQRIGYTVLNNLTDLIDSSSIQTTSYEVVFSKGFVSDFNLKTTDEEKSVMIGGERIKGNFLLAFSSALSHFDFVSDKEDYIQNSLITNDRSEFYNHRLFKLAAWSVMILLLFTLLINFIVFNQYDQKVARLSSEFQANEELISRLENLRSDYERISVFYRETGMSESSKISFYADQLASELPKRIYWDQLSINPPKGEIKKSEDVAFDIGYIYVEGVSYTTQVLEEWLPLIEKMNWVDFAEVVNYQKKDDTGKGEFVLRIKTNEL
ncbi:MAG: hypothetical protein CMC96_03610 [Flavobacteriales bacterium]|nr:hypothetical protein [Flavobacteriales bacterium]|tara:strand:- start:16965 stop:18191 length:1227 start_codon:yes stop_codon:yes gene_type:complete